MTPSGPRLVHDVERSLGGAGEPAETRVGGQPADRLLAGLRAERGYWLRAAGAPVPVAGSDHPYALLAAGRWREAAERWRSAGCRYEHAAALSESRIRTTR